MKHSADGPDQITFSETSGEAMEIIALVLYKETTLATLSLLLPTQQKCADRGATACPAQTSGETEVKSGGRKKVLKWKLED